MTRALVVLCLVAVLLGGGVAARAAPYDTFCAPLATGAWKPTHDQWGSALDVFKHDYPGWEDKTGRTLRDFTDYRFQFYGIRAKGQRLVVINAFCSEYWEQASEWRSRLVAVEGGGSCFFQAKVDVKTWSMVGLIVNAQGPARPVL